MKHIARITIFIGLMLTFALCASVQAAEQAPGTKSSGKQLTKEDKQTSNIMLRSARSLHQPVWIHNTWLDYVTDIDGDGFYHHFRFSFDADTSYASQALYAEVYLSDGDEQWLIFSSNTFWIYGDSGSDVYEMSTSLNDGYPAQNYDLVLRLYDADSRQLLEEWTYLDDSTLSDIYLEDAERDTVFSSTPYIHHFELTLGDDFDGDGYFSNVSFRVDVDAPNTESDIRIGVEIYDDHHGWESIYLSSEFTAIGNASNDAQSFSVDLETGFPSDRYQLRITVYESLSRSVLATETINQTALLESLDYESDSHTHVTTETRSSSSSGSGGSMGVLAIPLLIAGLIRRRLNK